MADLRPGQYKRLGRIAENNPQRAEKVAARMEKRASRTERGKEVAAKVQDKKAFVKKASGLMTKEEFEKRKSALNKSVGRDTPLAPSPTPSFLK
jgi:hypothetical protein